MSLPPRAVLAEMHVADAVRAELRGGTSGADLELGGLAVRAGGVPLFRRSERGGLRQCVRLVVRSSVERGRVRISAHDEEGVADAVALGSTQGEHTVRLFVPEVSEPRSFMLSVEGEGALSGRSPIIVGPERKWRVFLIHHSHLDVGYTDPQPLVLEHQLRYLDSVLELCERTESWPDAARFRWNIEANWPLQRWLSVRPGAAREAMLRRAREGAVEVCALPFTLHTEACSVDEFARLLAFADELRERHDIPVVTAMQTDVPGMPAGVPELLAAAGIRYLSVAHNHAGRAVPHLNGGQALTRPFWWGSGPGRRVLVWYTDSPHGVAYLEGNLLGLADSYELALECLPEYLAALAARGYPYRNGHPLLGGAPGAELTRLPYAHDLLHLRVQGEIADNAPPSLVPAEVARGWNERWAYPELRMATNSEFFARVEEQFADQLDSHAGDWGDWWADGLGSGARAVGRNRRAQGALRSAQALHAVADTLELEDSTGWADEADRAYESLALFDEHTWGSRVPWGDDLAGGASGVEQWERKVAFAHDGHDRAASLLDSAVTRLGRALPGGRGSISVVNPCGVVRSDLVEVFVPAGLVDEPVVLIDEATRAAVPHAVEAQDDPTHRPRGHHLRFLARNVPPLGYRRYAVVETAARGSPPEAAPDPLSLETAHYTLTVDASRGCAVSLLDHALSRELVERASPFGLGQLIHDRYTPAPHVHRDLLAQLPPAGPWALGKRSTAGFGVATERVSNPVEERLTVRLLAEGVDWLETTFRLPHGLPRVEILHRLAKVRTAAKESIVFAFPFAARKPEILWELTGDVDGPGLRRVPGAATHIRAIRHWLTLQDPAATIAWATLEAPLVEIGALSLPYAPYPGTVAAADGAVFSRAMVNVWDTNFPSQQGGETVFRYTISSAPPTTSARELGVSLGAALARPLVGVPMTGRSAPGPPTGTFCALDRADVELVTVTRSRRGHELVLFIHSRAEHEVDLGITFAGLPVVRVLAGTFLERDLREIGRGGEARVRIRPGEYLALPVDLGWA